MSIKTAHKNIYIDPYYTDSMPDEVNKLYEEGEKADILLLTHGHHDHCDPHTFETVLSKDTKIVAPKSCSDKIKGEFITVKPGDVIKLDDIEIKTVHAYNRKRKRDSGEPFHPRGEGVGYLITVEGKTIYHSGDTENISEMNDLGKVYTAFLSIDGIYTMDMEKTVQAAKVIRPSIVIPFHERDVDRNRFKHMLEKQTDIKVNLMV